MAIEPKQITITGEQVVVDLRELEQAAAMLHSYANELFPTEPGDAGYARTLCVKFEGIARARRHEFKW